VAVVGKNGAGKSTLLMSFFGGTNVSNGSMHVGGVDLRGLPVFYLYVRGRQHHPAIGNLKLRRVELRRTAFREFHRGVG